MKTHRKHTWHWTVLALVLLPLLVQPSQAAFAGDTVRLALPAPASSPARAGAPAALVVVTQAPPPVDAPALPDPLQLVIGAAITFLVVNGLKDFSNFVGQDLSGWGTVIAAGITAIVVFAINTLLQVAVTIDPALVPKVDAVFQIFVILLGAMGFKRTFAAHY